MRICIFGLGYVGTVTGASLAGFGHEIVGVDVSGVKVDLINSGSSPIVEPGLDDILGGAVASGRLRAVERAAEAVAWADVSLVCVGTPSRPNGSLDVQYVLGVCKEIGQALRDRAGYHLVVLRSTLLPGTAAQCAAILEAESGKREGQEFDVAVNPEFLREGSAILDFRNPPYTIVGTSSERAAQVLRELYSPLEAPFHVMEPAAAAMLKYANNAFHALKVVFANEIGMLCKSAGIDSHEVMNIFMADTRLNISPAYLRPGNAYGGSCLPKDLAALTHRGRELDVATPLLSAIPQSNREHLEQAFQLVTKFGRKRIGLLGLSFKAGTDDLRESPLVALVERLIGKGYAVRVLDPNVNVSALIGANRKFIEQQVPHIAELLVPTMADLVSHAEVVVVGNPSAEFRDVLSLVSPDQIVADLVRIDPHRKTGGNYHGLCW